MHCESSSKKKEIFQNSWQPFIKRRNKKTKTRRSKSPRRTKNERAILRSLITLVFSLKTTPINGQAPPSLSTRKTHEP